MNHIYDSSFSDSPVLLYLKKENSKLQGFSVNLPSKQTVTK